LKLASNSFEGNFPAGLVDLPNLHTLDLSHNHFVGKLPMSLDSLSSLAILDLSHNRFASNARGTVWPDLRALNLDYNQLTGELPIRGLSDSLIELKIANNEIAGLFPSEICSLTSLRVLDLSNNALRGRICETIGDLESLRVFNVSHNRLEGDIPPSLLMTRELTTLNLSHNGLASELPSTSSLLCLQIIDLSWNHLSGTLPEWFQNLHFLELVDVSHNNFRSGRENVLRSGIHKNIWFDPNPWENGSSNGLTYEQTSHERKGGLAETLSFINPEAILKAADANQPHDRTPTDTAPPPSAPQSSMETVIKTDPAGPAATITGQVVDVTGAGVPNTDVTVSSQAITKSAIADESGHFVLPVPPGEYKLRVSANGFEHQDIESVKVLPDNATNVTVVLKIGATTEAVEVSSPASIPEELGPWWNHWITKDGLPEASQATMLETGQEYTFYLELSPAAQKDVANGEQSAEVTQALRDYLTRLKMTGVSETFLFVRINVIGRALALTERVDPVASWTRTAGWIPQFDTAAAGVLSLDLDKLTADSKNAGPDISQSFRAGAIRFGVKALDHGCAAIAVSIWDQTRSLPLDHIVRIVSVGTQTKCSSGGNSEQVTPGTFSLPAKEIAPDVSLQVFEYKVNGDSRSAAFMALRTPSGPCESFHWASDSSVIDQILHSQNFRTVLGQARLTEGLYSSVGEQLVDAFFPSRHSLGGCGSADAFNALKVLSQQRDLRLYARISDTDERLVIVPLGLLAMFTDGGQRVFAHDIRVFQPIARQTLGPTECVKNWMFVLPSNLDGINPGDSRLDLPNVLGSDPRVVRSKQDFLTRLVDAEDETETPNGLLLLAHHQDGVLTFSAPGDSIGYTRFDRSVGSGSIAILSACETTNLTESTKLINRLNTDGVDAFVAASFELDISFGINFAFNFAETIAQEGGNTITLDKTFEKAMAQTVTYESKTTSPERARGMSLELVLAGNPELTICP
jgi:Carboxypeptidase regulatory-like domain/Leucine rich repeat/Leucine Rich Repeat